MKYTTILFLAYLLGCPAPASEQPTKAAKASSPSAAQGQNRREHIQHFKEKVDRDNQEQGWKPLGHNLWRNAAGDIAFRTEEMTEEDIGIVHYRKELCCDGPALKDAIDLGSFQRMKGSFYRDKDHIYHHFLMADGGTFSRLEKVDTPSFQVITGCYARDKNAIYTDKARVVSDADPASFYTTEEAGCFAKDKTGYFFWDDRIGSMDELDEHGRKAIQLLGPL